MKFLQKIAEAEIASDFAKETKQKSIKWTTPSGFPVIYEAFIDNEFKEKAIISCSERQIKPVIRKDDGTEEVTDTIRIQHVGKENTTKPKIKSFMSGISPNFVHSMDAAHMANVIQQWDGDFGAIHDSFSVHACDVDELLQIIKDEFVIMYDHDNYFNTIERMIVTNHNNFNYIQPKTGSLEIREVQDSEYFFA
jgi:DNA-directed RNA polymerase